MPPAPANAANGGGGGNPQSGPPAARTSFTLVLGDPSVKREDAWSLPADSPVVTSWPFVDWAFSTVAPLVASAPRSNLVGPCLMASRRPIDSSWPDLSDSDLLTSELDHVTASTWLHQMDTASAFVSVFRTFGGWIGAVPALRANAANPAALCLEADSFVEGSDYDDNLESHLAFLRRTSLASLIRCDEELSDEDFQPHALARALTLFGSKDNSAERQDDSSDVCIHSELVGGMLARLLHMDSPSASTMSSKFITCVHVLKLPQPFLMHANQPTIVLRELERAYDYGHGTAAEASAIERACILRVGSVHLSLEPVVKRFSDSAAAAVQLERLSAELLPASLSSSNLLVKLSALDEVLCRPAWSAAVTHSLNQSPGITGFDLVTALVNSQSELSGSAAGLSGVGGGGAGPLSSPTGITDAFLGNTGSYGSVRDQSVGDALRSEESLCALLCVSGPSTGIERVDTMMRSGSVLLTRAMFLQESWLLNKTPSLGFCSLEAPNLCPHIALHLTEDENGVVPDRLQSYVYPKSQLDIDRTPSWSKCRTLEGQMEIQRLLRGVTYRPVVESDRYTLESALRMQSEYGGRRCFALGLSLSPQDGYSFPDCVEKQIQAVNFAKTLPSAECAEWLAFLTTNYVENCLDAGGQYYHAKLRSARPDHPDSQLDAYLPPDNMFYRNIDARMRRAEPIAELRAAFPTLLSSAPISLPGSSSQHRASEPEGEAKNKRGREGGRGGKGKVKAEPTAKGSGPGSKSGWGYYIDSSHLWLCGMVFNVKDIAAHYKVVKPQDLCWPVLLTKKAGDDALQLCPESSGHGGLTSKAHKRPANFDLTYIYKNHTRKPSDAENAHAGWVPAKRSKKN